VIFSLVALVLQRGDVWERLFPPQFIITKNRLNKVKVELSVIMHGISARESSLVPR